MNTLQELLTFGEQQLFLAGVPDAKIDSWYLMEYALHITRATFLYDRTRSVTDIERKCYIELVKKRRKRIPLQYIIGEQEFMGSSFLVNQHVLIPRQDTEVLAEEVIKDYKEVDRNVSILDMCTGSGCILISLKKLAGFTGRSVGVDLSKEALEIAKKNAAKHNMELEWIACDLFQEVTGCFDIIVSNPPYIETKIIETLEPEVKDYEPIKALDGHEDGLFFYRQIAKSADDYLNPEGRIYLEIGCHQAEEVTLLLNHQGFDKIEVVKDLSGLNRVVKAKKGRLTEAK